MKKVFNVLLLITVSLAFNACNNANPCPECPPVLNDSVPMANCDSCCVNPNNNYEEADSMQNSIANADIFIRKLDVKYNESSDDWTATIHVKNHHDDNANNAMLVVTLPVNSSLKNVDIGHGSLSYQRCGGVVKVCLGSLDVCTAETLCNNPDNTGCERLVKITTSRIKGVHATQETFGAFVYSSTPDPWPANNFKSWKNTGASDNENCD